MVPQIHRAGASELRGRNFLSKVLSHCHRPTMSNLVQNLCSQMCQLFMPLCSHVPHLSKGWGDGAQHPCLA